MSFRPTQFEVLKQSTAQGEGEVRVVKVDETLPSSVQAFVPTSIRAPGQGTYAATKAKAGPLAATDEDRVARSQKDARFSLNAMLRAPLAVEEEERRAIEAKVQERTAAIAEQARREAAEKGFQEGLEKGFESATAQVRAEASDRVARFDQVLASFESARAEIFKANERFLIELIFRVARSVLLQELKTDREYVTRLCKTLLEKVGSREQILIKISQQDFEVMDQVKGALEATFESLQGLKIEVSNDVALGGCVVETQWNAIDASVETQLKNALLALTGEH